MLNLRTVLAVLSTPKLYAIDQEKIERSEPHLLDLDSDLEMIRNLQELVAQEQVVHHELVDSVVPQVQVQVLVAQEQVAHQERVVGLVELQLHRWNCK